MNQIFLILERRVKNIKKIYILQGQLRLLTPCSELHFSSYQQREQTVKCSYHRFIMLTSGMMNVTLQDAVGSRFTTIH